MLDSDRSLIEWVHGWAQLFWYGSFVIGAVLVVGPWLGLTGDALSSDRVTVSVTKERGDDRHEVDALVSAKSEDSARLELSFAEATIKARPARGGMATWFRHGALAVGYLIWLALVYNLKNFTATLANSTSFDPKNAGRIQSIGVAVLGLELVRYLAALSDGFFARANFSIRSFSIDMEYVPELKHVLFGLLIIAISEAFRRGHALEVEVEDTV